MQVIGTYRSQPDYGSLWRQLFTGRPTTRLPTKTIMWVAPIAYSWRGGQVKGPWRTGRHSADFSKAFDKVPHQRLLHKLHFYGVRRNTWNWEKDFLAKRTQQVTLKGQSSTRANVISAVSRGRWWNHYYFFSLSTFRCETNRWWLPVLLKNQPIADAKQLQRVLKSFKKWEREWKMDFHHQAV